MVAFLVVFLAFGLIGLEAWPLTGWRLFSLRRHETISELQAFAVDGEGDEHEIELIDLPMGYRHADRLLSGLDADERPGWCAAIARGVVEAGGEEPEEMRVYRVRERVPTDADEDPEVLDRELRFTC